MRRRDFARGLVALGLAGPSGLRAQSALPRVIVVGGNEKAFFQPFFASFERGLRALGQERGRTVKLDVMFGKDERVPVAAPRPRGHRAAAGRARRRRPGRSPPRT